MFRVYSILSQPRDKLLLINENLLVTNQLVKVIKFNTNIVHVIIEIIDEYSKTKQDAFSTLCTLEEELSEI